ncbi:unnamed protein product, partial [Ectocarpus sp. 12 AP-2014]
MEEESVLLRHSSHRAISQHAPGRCLRRALTVFLHLKTTCAYRYYLRPDENISWMSEQQQQQQHKSSAVAGSQRFSVRPAEYFRSSTHTKGLLPNRIIITRSPPARACLQIILPRFQENNCRISNISRHFPPTPSDFCCGLRPAGPKNTTRSFLRGVGRGVRRLAAPVHPLGLVLGVILADVRVPLCVLVRVGRVVPALDDVRVLPSGWRQARVLVDAARAAAATATTATFVAVAHVDRVNRRLMSVAARGGACVMEKQIGGRQQFDIMKQTHAPKCFSSATFSRCHGHVLCVQDYGGGAGWYF